MSTTNPRHAAFHILDRIVRERSYADILIDQELSKGLIQGPDRGLLTELVYGTLRRQGTLDYLIRTFSSIRIEKIERSVHILLRLGLYQLIFLDRIPPSAAVNETVKLAKLLAPKASGFVNAVLRETDRKRNSIPWPDRGADPLEWVAARHSVPKWIAQNWLDQLGREQAEQLAATMSEPPPVTIRANILKCSRDALIDILSAEQISAEPCRYAPHGIQILSHTPLTLLESFKQGLFMIQDEASQLAALILGVAPGDRVLDLCAAPGGKASSIAELMGNIGEIVACDSNPRRLKQVQLLANRLGIDIIRPVVANAENPFDPTAKPFHKVLVDAPCSGLGVLRRNPEGKWWKRTEDLTTLAGLQRRILGNAAAAVAPGGILVYSTCSTSPLENELVVDDFLSRHHDFMIEDIRETCPLSAPLCSSNGHFRPWPHLHGMDGFFAARIRRQDIT